MRRRGPWVPLLLLPLCLAAMAHSGSSDPPAADQARALSLQKDAVQRLREGARAAASGDAAAFSRALGDAARQIDALIQAAGLPDSEREALRRTAAGLRDRARSGPEGYSPDADLAVLDRVGYRLRGGTDVDLVFEGSFARTPPEKLEEPAYGGHATAMGPPPAEAPATAGPEHAVRFDTVRGQLTEKTYGGGPSKLHLVESGGNGIALIDYDGDGLLDVYAVSAFDLDERNGRARIPHRNALYRNLGGLKFRNVAAEAGVDLAAWGYGVCAGDYDDDGRLDLYVTNYGQNVLYRNRGDGTFEDATARAGVASSGWSTGCAFFDADGDGDLDLYVARYVTAPEEEVASPGRFLIWRGIAKVMLGPAGLPGAADIYYENMGNGRFEERTEARGLTDTTRAYGFGVLATDYDGDGWTDLFVANDSNPNMLYRNREGRGFESVGLAAGVALNAEGRAQAGMGCDSGDVDGDGRLDIAVAAFAFDHDSLYRNMGRGVFEDVSQQAGLVGATFQRMSWGLAFLDADLDGDLDLFFANGHLFPQVDEHPGAEGDVRATRPDIPERRRTLPRRLGHCGTRPDGAEVQPRGRGRRSRQRRGSRSRRQRHGRRADAARKHAAERQPLARGRREEQRPQPVRHWRAGHRGEPGGEEADSRDPLRRRLSFPERPPCPLRARWQQGAGRRRSPTRWQALAFPQRGRGSLRTPSPGRGAPCSAVAWAETQTRSHRWRVSGLSFWLSSPLSPFRGWAAATGRIDPPRAPGQPYHYRPKLAVSETLQPFMEETTPGSDLFPDERVAGELISELTKLSERLRDGSNRAHAADLLLAPGFRGGQLRPVDEIEVTRGPSLEIHRSRDMATKAALDAGTFARELGRLVGDFQSLTVAEFLITSIDVEREAGRARTDVRFDLVGPGRDAWRVQRTGTWRLQWRHEPSGWRVAEWTAVDDARSRASAPVFSEVTTAAFGSNDSFARQLSIGFDAWAATLDSCLARDSNGHHGVAVGDVDGDGLDDIYVAQPYGLPDRLYRARGDGTFEDCDTRAGLGTLEDTQQSLFADVDNDGDEDLILIDGRGARSSS